MTKAAVKMRKLAFAFAPFGLLLGCSCSSVITGSGPWDVTFVNASDTAVRVRVSIYDIALFAEDLPPGAEISMEFPPRGDAHFTVRVQPLPDGAEVTREVGYVSRGTGMNAVIRYDGEDITYDHRSKSRKLGGGAA